MKRGPNAGVYRWRDQIYIGQKAVAAAAGVSVSTVANHLDAYGHLDNLGMLRRPSRAKSFSAGGYHFPSAAELATKVGVHRATVRRWVREGRTDAILSALERASAGQVGDQRCRPFELDGRTWPSVAAFATAVGRPPVTIRLWLHKGDEARLRSALRDADMVDRLNRRAAA